MIREADFDSNFLDEIKNSDRKLVLYGIGYGGEAVYPFLKDISYVCDNKGNDGELFFHGIKVIDVHKLEGIDEKYNILISVDNRKWYQEIVEKIRHTKIDAVIYDLYNNIAFKCTKPQANIIEKRKLRKINIVLPKEGWTLGKIAHKMAEQLEKKGYIAQLSTCVDRTADINHHVIRRGFEPIQDNRDTLMITHVENTHKLENIKLQLEVARMGICMSRYTMEMLASMGVPRNKLCYINPAHDGGIKPKKYVLGMTHKSYEVIDHRKRDSVLEDIIEPLDPDFFEIKIMGPNWDVIVENARKMGFSVEYYSDFDYEIYCKLMPSLDYYLYWGYDEASLGYLDALTAGVKTLVTPQGYHLDAIGGATYLCRTAKDFTKVLVELENGRKKIIQSVSEWTWENYINKHIEVWNYILGNTENIYKNQHLYEDGIFSVF